MKTSCRALDRYIKENVLESKYYIDRIGVQINDLSVLDPTKQILDKLVDSEMVEITPNLRRLLRLKSRLP